MISDKMIKMVKGSSVIRAMFEEGNRLAKLYGRENVYDFSLGNPNAEPPREVKESIITALNTIDGIRLHGYMNNAGYASTRAKIAEHLNKLHGTHFKGENIIMTVGAAGGINVIFKTLLNPSDEVITFSPFFGEYRSYADNFDAKLVTVPCAEPYFRPNVEKLYEAITEKTKIVILNNPNNPTGVVYTEKEIIDIADAIDKRQKEYGNDIYIFSDEPYRELSYKAEVPYLTKYFKNTIVGYSYSKSLSLAGERIGYLAIPTEAADYENIVAAASIANRILGFVNAPSLIQRAVESCVDVSCDVEFYAKNAEIIYNGLVKIGYECVKPEGAFYLFLKSPVLDEREFCQLAKKYNILIVPSSAFGCAGYARVAYCVARKTIIDSLPKFELLYNEIKENK